MANKGGGIDPNAMYKAGFSSDARVTTRQDAKAGYWDGVAKEAYNVLGTAAIGQIKANYKQYQTMSNASESQMASVLMEIKKFPKNNEDLVQDLNDLKEKHRAATKTAAVGFGKKRSKAKAAAAGYLQQLKDFDAWLNIVAENRLKAQGMAYINAGTAQATDEQGAMSLATDPFTENNGNSLADGSMHQRLRWNSETGQGEVQVGGEWREDKVSGKKKYSDKAETGTYEEYVAENQEINLKLKGRQLASKPEQSEAVMGSRAQVDLAGNPIETPYEESETGKYAKESLSLTPNPPMSREEWTKLNQENRGLVGTIPYSQMRFPKEEDKIMGNNIVSLDAELAKMALKKDSLDWEYISETQNGKKQFAGTVNSYTNSQFKDFFFGGFSYDYANSRMGDTAPAYIFMKAEDEQRGNLNEDGSFKEGFGPGTKDWEGRLLTLKGQSFVKGSLYRQQVIDQQWDIRKEKYEANQKAYKDANPEDPQWKQEGYANKGAWLKTLSGDDDDSEETLKYGGFGYTSRTNGDPDGGLEGFGNVKYSDKVARRSSLLNFETVRGEHYQYRFEMDDKTKEKVWKAYSKKDGSFVRNMKDGAEVAGIEGLKGTQDTSDSVFNIERVIQNKKDKTNRTASMPGGVTQELLSEGNLDEIIKSFDEGIESKWTFLNSLDSDMVPRKDRIILQNKKTGKETTIKLGPNATAGDAEKMNKLLSDYVMSGPEPE